VVNAFVPREILIVVLIVIDQDHEQDLIRLVAFVVLILIMILILLFEATASHLHPPIKDRRHYGLTNWAVYSNHPPSIDWKRKPTSSASRRTTDLVW
jgi:hypothetical protein